MKIPFFLKQIKKLEQNDFSIFLYLLSLKNIRNESIARDFSCANRVYLCFSYSSSSNANVFIFFCFQSILLPLSLQICHGNVSKIICCRSNCINVARTKCVCVLRFVFRIFFSFSFSDSPILLV